MSCPIHHCQHLIIIINTHISCSLVSRLPAFQLKQLGRRIKRREKRKKQGKKKKRPSNDVQTCVELRIILTEHHTCIEHRYRCTTKNNGRQYRCSAKRPKKRASRGPFLPVRIYWVLFLCKDHLRGFFNVKFSIYIYNSCIKAGSSLYIQHSHFCKCPTPTVLG